MVINVDEWLVMDDSLVNVYITMERSTMLNGENSTISMAMFNRKLSQRFPEGIMWV